MEDKLKNTRLEGRSDYDSEFCGSIPLNFINLIQPHGILLIIEKDEYQIVQVSENIETIIGLKDSVKQLILVFFKESDFEQKFTAKESEAFDNQMHVDRYKELELELKETKESLHTLMEQMETANEELQSSNEELLSSNEELQSTNEELQSLNEELHTVNAEHHQKIKELIELNDDFNNYFRGTEIGQRFVN